MQAAPGVAANYSAHNIRYVWDIYTVCDISSAGMGMSPVAICTKGVVMKKIITAVAAASVFAAVPAFAHDWKAMDTNKDGLISKDEYEDAKEDKFERADKNGDDMLSKEEINAMWGAKKKHHMHKANTSALPNMKPKDGVEQAH